MAKQESLKTISQEELHNRHLEEKEDVFKKHQSPAPSWSELPIPQRKGYQPLEWNGKTYLHRELSQNFTETILLDEQDRPVEYWRNWDEPTERIRHSYVYDHEGFITSKTVLKGNGYGSSMKIEYLQDIDGNFLCDENDRRIPKQAIVQHYFGDPKRFAFSHREVGHGDREGESIVVDLIENEI